MANHVNVETVSADRHCRICGRRIPTENEADLCDQCLLDREHKRKGIAAGAAGVGLALFGARKKIANAAKRLAPVAKEYAPKVAKAIRKIRL
jgi:hypothetical protein